MSNICRDLKLEYEALQTLKQEFVSACENAGSVDTLSDQELISIKRLKLKLERVRDALDDKVENNRVRMWRGIYTGVMTAYLDYGPSKGRSVQEIISGTGFHTSLVDGILSDIRSLDIQRLGAVEAFSAASELKLLTQDEVQDVRTLLEDGERNQFVIEEIELDIDHAEGSMSAPGAVTLFRSAVALGLLSEGKTEEIRQRLETDIFRDWLAKIIVQDTIEGTYAVENTGEENYDFPLCLVNTYHAALDLGLLSDDVIQQIQRFHERENFKDEIVHAILTCAFGGATGTSETLRAQYVTKELNAIKGLIELSRRRKKK